ncbi:sigma-70 family RNA polymerase sigma factor [Clostridium sp. WB02_MRS01]|uniref:sigma factor-like helix-turn-helix DNA-binding protein n=1 Tax=Clostridium sp. WB02_MRS01 TaxID=2605777 RepID=UPI0012B2E6C4|nr:sigma factor-like helix-turn-helix DNA-binding protein [Clostridium sp. WB02_MRS01]MSS11810.1 sigma-70 family RNA polymerase sigma factor [Clostridium sp. WB02_MRS01]
MAKRIKINYRKRYPEASDMVIEVLEKSDRKMEYEQYDLKVERCHIDSLNRTVTYIPSREDSYERLMGENRQFVADQESVEDAAVNALLIEKMLSSLKLLTPQEQELISELFFIGKSEHQLSAETGIPRMTIHNRKRRILAHLKKLMEK